MKKWFALGGIFFTSYLVFILATLPLPWLLTQLTIPNTVQLSHVSGSVWEGEIEQVILSQGANSHQIQQVKTALSFWSLFSLAPKVELRFGDALLTGPEGTMTLVASENQLSFTEVNILLSANDIAQQIDLPLPVVAKGDLRLVLSQFDVALHEKKCLRAKGNVNWTYAGITAMEQSIKLGQLKAKISCSKGGIVLNLDPKNDLGISFSVDISPTGNNRNRNFKLSGEGYLKPGKKFPAQIRPVLPFLGKPDNQGRYLLGF